jgi:hypothetical protein
MQHSTSWSYSLYRQFTPHPSYLPQSINAAKIGASLNIAINTDSVMALNFFRKRDKSPSTISPGKVSDKTDSDPNFTDKIDAARRGIDKYQNALIKLAE